jgi:hypothetical protein
MRSSVPHDPSVRRARYRERVSIDPATTSSRPTAAPLCAFVPYVVFPAGGADGLRAQAVR